jgi:hypothetical protein
MSLDDAPATRPMVDTDIGGMVRRTDPETSALAARRAKRRATTDQDRVLAGLLTMHPGGASSWRSGSR